MNKDWMQVYLRQGDGQDELSIAIMISPELDSKMNEIRGRNPQKWENKDLDLMKEAETELREY